MVLLPVVLIIQMGNIKLLITERNKTDCPVNTMKVKDFADFEKLH